jgi:hypothetical protein
MSSSKSLLSILTSLTVLLAAAAPAETIDMNDPRRAVGRENDVRVDAQLADEFVSAHSTIGVRYQIQNFSTQAIAVADKVCDASYDSESRTITVSIGSEVPANGEMPRLVTIRPGEKKTFSAGVMLKMNAPVSRTPFSAGPRFVQIRVNVLRDLAPFLPLIEQQGRARAAIALTDQQFDQWLESKESIVLNAMPVRYRGDETSRVSDASLRSPRRADP